VSSVGPLATEPGMNGRFTVRAQRDQNMIDDVAVSYYKDLFAQVEELREAMSWAVVEAVDGPLSIADVVVSWGAKPEDLSTAIPDESFDSVHFVQHGGAVIVIEPNGFQTTRPEVLRRLSARGRTQSAFWNVNATVELNVAYYGTVTACWHDRSLSNGTRSPESLRSFADDAARLTEIDPTLNEELVSAGLEAGTGVRLLAEHLLQPQASLLAVPEVASDPQSPGVFAHVDAEVDFALRQLSQEDQREVIAGIIKRSLKASSVLHAQVWEVAEALPTAAGFNPRAVKRDLLDPLMASLQEQRLAAPDPSIEHDTILRQQQALIALERAIPSPSGLGDRLYPLLHARAAFGSDWSRERQAVLDDIRTRLGRRGNSGTA
jgi:hypothetical protein